MSEQPEQQEEQRGRMDLASYLYVICGIPLLAFFFVALFFFARTCDVPA